MSIPSQKLDQVKLQIKQLALEQGFQDMRISDCDTGVYFDRFKNWVSRGFHGTMSYLERNQLLRQEPAELHPGTLRIISLRYNYLVENAQFAQTLADNQRANVSRYALGKDYHKLLRKKLDSLCRQLQVEISDSFKLEHRVFVDSAPVLETAFAEKSGIGWKGKHSLIINKEAGSWFFLAEIFIGLPLAVDPPVEDLCGKCTACITLCPTNAILEDKTIDARKCISYLTIENKAAIPTELRAKMGNRIYGCDDCQLACPWNRYSDLTQDTNFNPRHQLDNITLLELWAWDEKTFLKRFEGSPIRRIGFQSWLRNLAVAIGNGAYSEQAIQKLRNKKSQADPMVDEHIDWAVSRLTDKRDMHEEEVENTRNKTQKLIRCVNTMLTRDA